MIVFTFWGVEQGGFLWPTFNGTDCCIVNETVAPPVIHSCFGHPIIQGESVAAPHGSIAPPGRPICMLGTRTQSAQSTSVLQTHSIRQKHQPSTHLERNWHLPKWLVVFITVFNKLPSKDLSCHTCIVYFLRWDITTNVLYFVLLTLYYFPIYSCDLGWGLLKVRLLIAPLAKDSILQKYMLDSSNHIHIWQMSRQRSCSNICQIWTWFSIGN